MTSDIEKKISELRMKARECGLEVRFRNTVTDAGDFCIYIYDKSFRKSYAVGFDGSWNGSGIHFDACLRMAYRWMKKRDKRFTFRDGRWQYGRYHLIIWENRKGGDMDYYLTLEEAAEVAEGYVSQGCCVVCYDEPPTGRSTLAKVWGDYVRHTNKYVTTSIMKWAIKRQRP